jgi:hypothetical protein
LRFHEDPTPSKTPAPERVVHQQQVLNLSSQENGVSGSKSRRQNSTSQASGASKYFPTSPDLKGRFYVNILPEYTSLKEPRQSEPIFEVRTKLRELPPVDLTRLDIPNEFWVQHLQPLNVSYIKGCMVKFVCYFTDFVLTDLIEFFIGPLIQSWTLV